MLSGNFIVAKARLRNAIENK